MDQETEGSSYSCLSMPRVSCYWHFSDSVSNFHCQQNSSKMVRPNQQQNAISCFIHLDTFSCYSVKQKRPARKGSTESQKSGHQNVTTTTLQRKKRPVLPTDFLYFSRFSAHVTCRWRRCDLLPAAGLHPEGLRCPGRLAGGPPGGSRGGRGGRSAHRLAAAQRPAGAAADLRLLPGQIGCWVAWEKHVL